MFKSKAPCSIHEKGAAPHVVSRPGFAESQLFWLLLLQGRSQT